MIYMKKLIIKAMNIFYAIWADAINYERKKNGGEEHWKPFTFSYMSLLLSFNITTLLSVINFITGYSIANKIEQLVTFPDSELLTNFSWATVTLFIPSMIINYFFVFYKRKYEYILNKYKFKNGKLLLSYFILTIVLMFGFSMLNK